MVKRLSYEHYMRKAVPIPDPLRIIHNTYLRYPSRHKLAKEVPEYLRVRKNPSIPK